MSIHEAAMVMIKPVLVAAVFCTGVLSFTAADAALVAGNDGATVYDTANDLTWLADANLAATKSFGVRDINPDGSMGWTTAQEWIAAMNATNYLGSNKWSLPSTRMPDAGCSQNPKSAAFGYGCIGSQMGKLYYDDLGGVKGSTI